MAIRMANLLLAGDVGGSKTVLALLSPDTGTAATVAEATFENRKYVRLEEIVADFLARHPQRPSWASFSVAGPVNDGRVLLSNAGWQLDAEDLRAAFGFASVHLVNDLQATAYAVAHLSSESIHTLQSGRPLPRGARAVLAPGTGLGEAYLLWNGSSYEAWPSEGGNTDFAPADALQCELLGYLQQQWGHVSTEQVCSGLGIPNLYRFLRDAGVEQEPEWLAERLAGAVDPTPVIADAALRSPGASPLCRRTMELFASILAAEAGNMAIRLLASGGVFIGGGIPPRILPFLQCDTFLACFRRKGKFSDAMRHFPVHVILEPRAAMIGAGHYGFRVFPLARPAKRGTAV
jgi:glucokinase